MSCNYCGKDAGPHDICHKCMEKSKVIVFDSVEDAVRHAEAKPPGIISIYHVIKYEDKFLLVGHINCEHCAYCSEELPLLAPNAFVTGPHEPKVMYPEQEE